MSDATLTPGGGYWTPERIMMRDVAREFALEEVTPLANRLDPVQGDIPRELISRMGELGFFGILIPEEYGGLGLGAFEYCLVAEELSRGWMSVASLIARGNEFYKTIPGTPAERKQKIAAMIRGDYLGAGALSEPQTGSDLSSVATRARREGDEWVITGNKYWCTFADGSD
jgi:alkylation response protein AidB-like acyl-CoA dehydrogenase